MSGDLTSEMIDNALRQIANDVGLRQQVLLCSPNQVFAFRFIEWCCEMDRLPNNASRAIYKKTDEHSFQVWLKERLAKCKRTLALAHKYGGPHWTWPTHKTASAQERSKAKYRRMYATWRHQQEKERGEYWSWDLSQQEEWEEFMATVEGV